MGYSVTIRIKKLPHLVMIYRNVRQRRRNISMPKQLLYNMNITIGFPHQLSGNCVPEPVRANPHIYRIGKVRIECPYLIHIHPFLPMPHRENIHINS